MLQGILCDTGIPRTFYGENICSVEKVHQNLNVSYIMQLLRLICGEMNQKILSYFKAEKIINSCLNSIPSPSPSMKIQIMGGKVRLRCKGKTFLFSKVC